MAAAVRTTGAASANAVSRHSRMDRCMTKLLKGVLLDFDFILLQLAPQGVAVNAEELGRLTKMSIR